MREEIIAIKRTKEEVTIEDLAKIKELTQRIKNVKKELIKLMKEKEEISDSMYNLMRDGYCDIEMENGEEINLSNTSPKFKEAIKDYQSVMSDTSEFWLDYIDNIDEAE